MASLTINLDTLDRLRNGRPWWVLAEEIGVDPGTLSRVKNGKSKLSTDFIANVVTVFPIRMDELVDVSTAPAA